MQLRDHYEARLAPWSDIQDHLEFLYEQVAKRTKPVVIELGVRSGNSTAALLAGCEASGGHLYSADVNPPDVPPEFFTGPWSFRQGDSVSETVLNFMPAQCDVLFVDTSHTVAQTIAELTCYMPRVNQDGGIALFHDTSWMPPAVSLAPHVGGPVAEALNTWCQSNGYEWRNRDSAPGLYGMGIIEP